MYEESNVEKDDGNLANIRIAEYDFEGTYHFAMKFDIGKIRYAITDLKIEEQAIGTPTKPFMTLHKDTVQNIFNRLWHLGFRPKDGTGNSGHIEALKYHLEDMRTLALKK